MGEIKVYTDEGWSAVIYDGHQPMYCGEQGNANMLITPGFHQYNAVADSGQTWRGDVMITRRCTMVKLD